MPEVDFAWSTDDVTKMTDTDLLATRTVTMYCKDPSLESHKRGLALAEHLSNGDEWNVPQSGDHALRIYLAYLMDSTRIEDIRDQFDVAYTIPPAGWVLNEFETYDVEWESVDDADTEFSIVVPEPVHDMCIHIVEMEDNDFDEQAELISAALEYVVE